MLKPFLILALVLSCPIGAFAEEQKESEVWQNIKSPVTTDGKLALYVGGGLTASLLLLKNQVVDPAQEETTEHKPLGSSSTWGDHLGQVYPNAVYVLGMWGYGEFAKDHKALRDASLMFQATLYSATVATILKYTVREPRPNNSERRNSFPSGHSTTIFAFASYIGCRHSLPWGLAAYTAAAFVGFSRMNDNAHYLHDVTAGAAIGSAYGLGVCMAEERRLDKEKPVETMGYVVPIVNGLAAGFTHTF